MHADTVNGRPSGVLNTVLDRITFCMRVRAQQAVRSSYTAYAAGQPHLVLTPMIACKDHKQHEVAEEQAHTGETLVLVDLLCAKCTDVTTQVALS